jgi:hypothetical protein
MTESYSTVKGWIRSAVRKASHTPNFPDMITSATLFLPSEKFMEEDFFPCWQAFMERNKIDNSSGLFCESLARFAAGVMGMCAQERAKKTKQDAAPAFFIANIFINKPIFKGGLDHGGHALNLVVTSERRIALWEPQNPRMEYVDLEEAIDRVDLCDVY